MPSLVLLAVLVGVCVGPGDILPISKEDIPGIYRYDDGLGINEVALRSDGYYEEMYIVSLKAARYWSSEIRKPGTVYRNSGQWRYRVNQGRMGVVLERSMVWWEPIRPSEQPRLSDSVFRPHRDGWQIILEDQRTSTAG